MKARVFIVIGIMFLGLSLYSAVQLTRQSFSPASILYLFSNPPDSDGFEPISVRADQEETVMAPTLESKNVFAEPLALPTAIANVAQEQEAINPGLDEEAGYVPERLVIPAIKLDAPVVRAVEEIVEVDGVKYEQWLAPDEFAAGWHTNSALVGLPGNTVINGHHNVYGKVFANLIDLQAGDRIVVYSGNRNFTFVVTNIMIAAEKKMDLATRLENARWIQRSEDVRLTLVTCWPPESNTHRLIVVARPFDPDIDSK